jgi:hypothetical protein
VEEKEEDCWRWGLCEVWIMWSGGVREELGGGESEEPFSFFFFVWKEKKKEQASVAFLLFYSFGMNSGILHFTYVFFIILTFFAVFFRHHFRLFHYLWALLNAFYICCTQGSIKNNVPSNTPAAAAVVVVLSAAAPGCISLLQKLVFWLF